MRNTFRLLLAVLLAEENAISNADLMAQAGVTSAQIKAMQAKGLILGEDRRVETVEVAAVAAVGVAGFVDGKVINAVKGECKTVNLVYTDVNENGKIDLDVGLRTILCRYCS